MVSTDRTGDKRHRQSMETAHIFRFKRHKWSFRQLPAGETMRRQWTEIELVTFDVHFMINQRTKWTGKCALE